MTKDNLEEKDKLEESEYVVIKKWYQKTEEAMDKAWRTEGKGFEIEKVGQAMFLATSQLLQDRAPDIDIYRLGEIQKQFLPILKKAEEEFKRQKENYPDLRITREEDGIFSYIPDIIQSFFHAIAKYFREDNPTVADLMENAAKIVYDDAKKNSAEYTKNRVAKEEYEKQTREKEERADAKFRLRSKPQETAERIAAVGSLNAVFNDSNPVISANVLSQAARLGAQALSGGTPSSTSSPQTQKTGHGRTGSLGVAKK